MAAWPRCGRVYRAPRPAAALPGGGGGAAARGRQLSRGRGPDTRGRGRGQLGGGAEIQVPGDEYIKFISNLRCFGGWGFLMIWTLY